MEFKEVIYPEEANRVVIISEAYGRNYVRKRSILNYLVISV